MDSRRNIMRTGAFLALLLGILGSGTPLAAQEHLVIKGTVSDSATHEPIPGVNVTVRGKNIGTSTDSSGHYVLSIPKGAYIIAFSHIAYRKLLRTVAPGQPSTSTWDIVMVSSPIQLGEVSVTARRPFAQQRALFALGAADFEKLGDQRMDEALVYLLPTIFSSAEARYRSISRDFTLYVNGKWMESLFINDVDPFTVRQVLVWEKDWSPIGYPLRRGDFVVSITTK